MECHSGFAEVSVQIDIVGALLGSAPLTDHHQIPSLLVEPAYHGEGVESRKVMFEDGIVSIQVPAAETIQSETGLPGLAFRMQVIVDETGDGAVRTIGILATLLVHAQTHFHRIRNDPRCVVNHVEIGVPSVVRDGNRAVGILGQYPLSVGTVSFPFFRHVVIEGTELIPVPDIDLCQLGVKTVRRARSIQTGIQVLA